MRLKKMTPFHRTDAAGVKMRIADGVFYPPSARQPSRSPARPWKAKVISAISGSNWSSDFEVYFFSRKLSQEPHLSQTPETLLRSAPLIPAAAASSIGIVFRLN
jgi:hypothetical protein